MPTLNLIRGLPGAGKSTYALAAFPGTIIVEPEQFFMVDGEFKFDAGLIDASNRWCKDTALWILREAKCDVVVTGVLPRKWQIELYATEARKLNVNVLVTHVIGKFVSTHNVPLSLARTYAAAWEEYPNEEIYDTSSVEEES